MKEIFIYNTKNMNNPGQIKGTYKKESDLYYRVQFVRTGEIEYVKWNDAYYDSINECICYKQKEEESHV